MLRIDAKALTAERDGKWFETKTGEKLLLVPLMPVDRYGCISAAQAIDKLTDNVERAARQFEIMKLYLPQVVIGWQGILDSAGKEIQFSADLLKSELFIDAFSLEFGWFAISKALSPREFCEVADGEGPLQPTATAG